ncbi:MAG: hypothetical protein GFH27_549287n337 [Chloroflexi bacterium AL-W]|nr:hypothetical protein [Chloroflexi bacterium AL-N1]NOK66611.1 hypothetical protein [Chloroflexi bacterium AL-N10]NOK71999.1 hypothetical protein [Chloroflexi bacterium AL-N5]NOK81256.1 hypothetical protein [Chloroflexi bacterium AL-W]NOK89529.1 hypothetical protein [Chloroflexi bacterium AL-N15]
MRYIWQQYLLSVSLIQMIQRIARVFVLGVGAVAVSGCLLMAGQQQSSDFQEGAGNLSVAFVSAEGSQRRTIATEAPAPGELNVIVLMSVDRGDLRLDLLEPDGSVAFSIEGSPEGQRSRSGTVSTDDQGRLHYRVVARNARNGSFQILYQRLSS